MKSFKKIVALMLVLVTCCSCAIAFAEGTARKVGCGKEVSRYCSECKQTKVFVCKVEIIVTPRHYVRSIITPEGVVADYYDTTYAHVMQCPKHATVSYNINFIVTDVVLH